MFAKYSVGAQRAAPALARHLLCPKTTLYSAGINKAEACANRHVSETPDAQSLRGVATQPSSHKPKTFHSRFVVYSVQKFFFLNSALAYMDGAKLIRTRDELA